MRRRARRAAAGTPTRPHHRVAAGSVLPVDAPAERDTCRGATDSRDGAARTTDLGATIPHPARSTRTPTPTATTSAVCLGAVRYELPLSDPGPLPSSLCFATGGVLRLAGIGPGEVTVDREDLVDSQYEAGVVDLRFVRTGTVDVFVPREAGTHVITVVVR
ncbi:hypothetical protein GCM10029963_20180 [Micromonospora andamanensis]